MTFGSAVAVPPPSGRRVAFVISFMGFNYWIECFGYAFRLQAREKHITDDIYPLLYGFSNRVGDHIGEQFTGA